jgi:hypothetical protein
MTNEASDHELGHEMEKHAGTNGERPTTTPER